METPLYTYAPRGNQWAVLTKIRIARINPDSPDS